MAQIINTNVPSLNAQRNLAVNQKGLATTLERLSTGLRINSAKDDAAGLAISERFTTQIRGLDQATRNANDGISLSQTAEAALSTVGTNLQRIRELSVQAANGTNSASDRKALDEEVQQLISEVRRVALNSEFNGEAILDGSKGSSFFQIGPNQGQMISITNMDSRPIKLGNQEAAFVDGQGLEAYQLEQMTNDIAVTVGDITITPAAIPPLTPPGATNIVAAGPHNSLEDAVSSLNAEIQKKIDAGDDEGKGWAKVGLKAFLRTNNDGTTGIAITSNYNPGELDTNASIFSVAGGATNGVLDADGNADDKTLFDGSASVIQALDPLDATTPGVSVLTRQEASRAMGIVDGALNQINSLRAEMGAVQRRFETTIDNLRVGHESMSAARSRIRDADFAAETAELTRVQILQQSGISVLTQANALPQQALQLLGG
ncbi:MULTISPECIES: flagellin N-terminal helical domain-containing protein [Thiorhodovibrio]|uniref:flagellin N-terminal helical domain-containing protein n=1 Tax=Thiorhodovibrio TaxID=61593 RepID=UPI001912EFB1|nr:flagellin [Thiorhodovibrio litoralis]MBK5967658.1 flagellin [Thiorhodovibrio winogradskyi]WPL11605.1 A-type flagellin [Thiorhodovibrio litoralis]